ncbi:MAG TPA: ATP-binding protein [Polyangia bacterium]|nr:ATP-binding protein [Polyangia bacterium]
MPFSGPTGATMLSAILEDLPVGVWVARAPGGELVYANRAFAEIMGTAARDDVGVGEYAPVYGIEDREGKPFPEDRLPFVQALRRRETVVVDDIVIRRADGSRVSVRASGKPFFDAAGAITHVAVAFIDISAEVTAAAASHVAQHKLRLALQHAPIVLFASDVDGTITLSEGAALQRMGLKSGELVGRSMLELYADNAAVLANHARALSGESFTAIAELGSVVLETWLSPMRGLNGEIGGVIGVATDVTERLGMQRKASQTERLAALGRLAASVAHEINNPLAYSIEALRLASETIARDGATAPARDGALWIARLDELLREARDGMDRVRHITRDLKLFSRDDEEVRRPHKIECVLTAAVKMVATRVGARARVEIEPGPSATVLADENRLVQIFVNLMLNAADALPVDGVARNRITLRRRLEPGAIVVEVCDNGPGIARELRDRVFEPFFTTKPVGEGTGLGLFVTRNLVESLGGMIALTDAPGGGARFVIRLPTIAEVQAPAAATKPSATSPARTPGRARVLIIDDEPQLARVFRAAIAAHHDVETFTSGRAALTHLLGAAPYDLVLCDLMMADFSGMEVFEAVRRERPGLERVFVFMTGGVFDPQVAEFLASVPNDCVDKPFDIRAEVARRMSAR